MVLGASIELHPSARGTVGIATEWKLKLWLYLELVRALNKPVRVEESGVEQQPYNERQNPTKSRHDGNERET